MVTALVIERRDGERAGGAIGNRPFLRTGPSPCALASRSLFRVPFLAQGMQNCELLDGGGGCMNARFNSADKSTEGYRKQGRKEQEGEREKFC